MCAETRPLLQTAPDYHTLSRLAADVVMRTVRASPACTIALPTGSTPLGLFDELIRRVDRGELDLSRVHFQCLDEYVGVTEDHPTSLTAWLWVSFFGQAGIARDHVHPLPATAADHETAAAHYEDELAMRGGLELAVLGLGANGHIAYNEPGSTADSRTRTLALTPESISQAVAYWPDAVEIPQLAMTVGVGTLLEARQILLIVSGAAKAPILRQTLEEPMSPTVPASWLRLAGDRLMVIADDAAVKLISRSMS